MTPELIAVVHVVVLALLVVSLGAILTVGRLHLRAYRQLPRPAGLAPLHVALVSFGVLQLQVGLAWGLIDTITAAGPQPLWMVLARTALYGSGSLTILVALYVVGQLQRRRVTFGRDRTTVTVHTDETVAVETDEPRDH